MEEKLTTEQWIKAIKALLFANQDLDESDIDVEYIKQLIQEEIAGEGGEAGYKCTETTEQLFNETVTTVESGGDYLTSLNYAEPIEADELTVVFNGTEYVCSKIVDSDVAYYGGVDPNTATADFTNYPFVIISHPSQGNDVLTESPMTATVSASVASSTVETTECFEKAVKSVVDAGYKCTETMEELFDETVTTVQDGDVADANLSYSERITVDELTVTFNGIQYVCPKIISHGGELYGGVNEIGDFDFTNYPFCIGSMSGANVIVTESPMTATVSVSVPSIDVETTECFRRAVESVLTSSESSGK